MSEARRELPREEAVDAELVITPDKKNARLSLDSKKHQPAMNNGTPPQAPAEPDAPPDMAPRPAPGSAPTPGTGSMPSIQTPRSTDQMIQELQRMYQQRREIQQQTNRTLGGT